MLCLYVLDQRMRQQNNKTEQLVSLIISLDCK